ncbi:ATP-binding cassette domain-containing protein [Streptomyces sp. NPDC058052]|uniref:ATP-binding cassette domain-containing protein n=1 Tax=Streptomyces sp. NPDC058052 TaxID=3346316 RepID=UPI0036EDAF94
MRRRAAEGARPGTPREALLPLLVAPLTARPGLLARLILWSLVEAAPALLAGHLVARAVDHGFAAGNPAAGLGWLALMGAGVFAGAWGTRQAYPLLADAVEPFRDDLVRQVAESSLHQAVAGRSVDASGVSRLTLQVEMVREAYAGVLMVVRGFLLTVGGALLGLVLLAPAALILVVPPFLAGLGLFLLLLRRMASAQRDVILADERVAEATGTAHAAVRDIVACGAEDGVRAELTACVDAQEAAARRLAALLPVRVLCLAVAGWLPLILLLAAAPGLRAGGLTTGAVLGAATYVTGGLQPAVRSLVQGLGGSGLRLAVALRRIRETSRRPATPAGPVPDARSAGPVPDAAPGSSGPAPGPAAEPAARPASEPAARPAAAVELTGVSFGYGAHADPVLRDLDLVIPEGGHLVVVGPSGIGKSTLSGLIGGVLAPDRGRVRIGGLSPGSLAPAELAARRVLVPQEAYVFSGTLMENLRYLRPDAPVRDVIAAVDAVGAGPLAGRLGGIGATVDPAALSAGERQQIALARAFLSPAPLVLLDEATCHLDPAAEAHAEEAFARRPGTLVVIAHRISSALRAPRVLVMDGDRVVGGTHREVLAASPLYRDLVGHWSDDGSPPHDGSPTHDGDAVASGRTGGAVRATPPPSRS